VYITERLTVNNVTGTSVAGGTTTVFETSLLPADGTYDGMEIEFTSGPCKGQQATILTYLQLNGQITLVTADALSTVPGADTFIIWTEEDLAAGGPGSTVNFDLPINSRFCKISYIKIVQLTGGAMDLDLEIWESTAARGDPANRNLFYQQILSRHLTLTAVQGGQYGESLSGDPMPYYDRDAQDEEKTYRLHCRLENFAGGTASDFAVSVKVADPGERV
jgi:hypothetical protein